MSILTAENISHGFGGRQILENASFRLLNGEHVGLIGANGEGKSTFLNIITGQLMPDEGRIEWCNRITTGYLDQHTVLVKGKSIRDVLKDAFHHMFDLEQEMLRIYDGMEEVTEDEMEKMLEDVGDIQGILEHSGFYSIDSKISSIANGLGLGDIGLDRDVSELSGGQRSKVLLTKLLLENPMILILDEPTNFLDENHIEWLTSFLQNYENSFILVSHDTPFLSRVVNVIYHVENTRITRYTGGYEQFSQMYELKKVQNLQAYTKQQKEIDKLEEFVARNKARASTANMAKSRQKKLDGMDIIVMARTKARPSFKFREGRTTGKVVFNAQNLVLGYDEPLTRPVTIQLERGQKVAVKGVNGLGKSTLLKTLMGLIPPVSGVVAHDSFLIPGYFEQESSGGNNLTALEEIWKDFPGLSNGEVRAALARCGLTADHIESQMMVLSGGENSKVRLCKLMLKDVNCLVLDEPTNHLDADAKEELQKALREFRGTILMVSHEPEFYQDWITDVWNVEDWTNKVI